MKYDAFISYSHSADGRLAPAVQSGLHRLARPWYRRRALRVFRDETGLAVNPHLWDSIQGALDDSRYFVLLASPAAAASPWVNREIERWLATNSSETLLPVLTEGELVWDEATGGYDVAASTALPAALVGAFATEPLHLDLRWARDENHLTLRHSMFRSQIATLAAPIHGIPKDDLEGEDVVLHRRALRLAWGAGVALLFLTVAALAAAVSATSYANTAREQRHEAQAQARLARAAEALAKDNEARANKLSKGLDVANVDLARNIKALRGKTADLDEANAELSASNQALTEQSAELSATNAALVAAQEQTLRALDATELARQATARALEETRMAQKKTLEALAAEQAARREKERQRLAGVARQLVAASHRALQEGDIDRGVLLAAQATRFATASGGLVPVADVQQPLVDALQRNPALITWLRGLDGAIVDVAVSPDGNRAAAVSEHDRVAVWDLADFHLIAAFAGPARAEFVGFLSADTVVVAGFQELVAYRSDGASWRTLWRTAVLDDHVVAMAVAPGGPIAVSVPATADAPNRVRIFDTAGKAGPTVEVDALGSPTADPFELAISDDGAHFAVADNQSEDTSTVVRVYSTGSAVIPPAEVTTGGTAQGPVTDLRLSHDGGRLGVLTADNRLHRFDVGPADEEVIDLRPPPNVVHKAPIAIGPDLDRAVQRYQAGDRSGVGDDLIGVGFVAPPSFAGDLDAPATVPLYGDYDNPAAQGAGKAVFRGDGAMFLTAGGRSVIPVFASPDRWRSRVAASRTTGRSGGDTHAVLSPDGSVLVAVDSSESAESTMRVLTTKAPRRAFSVRLPRLVDNSRARGRLLPPASLSRVVTFGDSSDVVAIAFLDGSVELRSTRDGTRVMPLPTPHPCDTTIRPGPNVAECAELLPDISFFGSPRRGAVVQASDSRVQTWTLHDGHISDHREFAAPAIGVRLTKSGDRLVVLTKSPGHATPEVTVYARAGAEWNRIRSFALSSTRTLTGAAVAPDGRRLATTDGRHVLLHDLDHGTLAWSQESGDARVWFDAGGDALFTASDGVLSVRTTGNGVQQFTLELPSSRTPDTQALAVAADADHVTFAGGVFAGGLLGDMTLQVADWRLAVPDLVGAACREAGRYLTRAEWTLHVGTVDAYDPLCRP